MTHVRIRERFKTINKHNPISGHRWTEHGKTTGFEVVGPYGLISCHKTADRAKTVAGEYEAFFDKFGTGLG